MPSHLFLTAVVAMNDVMFAQRTCGIDAQPLINAASMKVMTTLNLPHLHFIFILREADATFLHM